MANRHTHKKLRAEARHLAAATGESYQRALQRIRKRTGTEERPLPPALRGQQPTRGHDPDACDLVALTHCGRPATLATFEAYGRPVLMLVPHPFRGKPFPTHGILGWTTLGGGSLA